MARTNKTAFEADEIRLAEYAKALSHPARVAILKMLAEVGVCICGEIVGELPLAQATVSQHLKVLKEAGLLKGDVEGPRSCYCIDPEGVAAFKRAMDTLFNQVQSSCCTPNKETSS
jgi:ArsR family transcriptional regulator, arsenate/arsenite/antimonite-responsive transcriptional repressor